MGREAETPPHSYFSLTTQTVTSCRPTHTSKNSKFCSLCLLGPFSLLILTLEGSLERTLPSHGDFGVLLCFVLLHCHLFPDSSLIVGLLAPMYGHSKCH